MSREAKRFDQILKLCLFGERGGGSKLWLWGSTCIVNSEEGRLPSLVSGGGSFCCLEFGTMPDGLDDAGLSLLTPTHFDSHSC